MQLRRIAPRKWFSTPNIIEAITEIRTVGITRFWTAASHNDRADLLVEIQRNAGISTADRCQLEPGL